MRLFNLFTLMFLLSVPSCFNSINYKNQNINCFTNNIGELRAQMYIICDSIGGRILSDEKFKISKRERKNQVKIQLPCKQLKTFDEWLKKQEGLNLKNTLHYSYSKDSCLIQINLHYFKY